MTEGRGKAEPTCKFPGCNALAARHLVLSQLGYELSTPNSRRRWPFTSRFLVLSFLWAKPGIAVLMVSLEAM